MGCDIHACIEFREKDRAEWEFFAEVNLDRWYAMFGCLAGVRGDGPAVVEQRGLPKDLSYWGRLHEGKEDFGDHSYTWLNADEWQRACEACKPPDGDPYSVVLLVMRAFEASDKEARCVFGFDS